MKESDQIILEKITAEMTYLEGLLEEMSEEDFLADETSERAAAMTSKPYDFKTNTERIWPILELKQKEIPRFSN